MNGFEAGYGLYAVVPDDTALAHPQDLNVTERLERAVYLRLDQHGIWSRCVAGEQMIL